MHTLRDFVCFVFRSEHNVQKCGKQSWQSNLQVHNDERSELAKNTLKENIR